MKKNENKRKINRFKTLEARLVKRKLNVSPFVQVGPKHKKRLNQEKLKKDKPISTAVGCFQLAIIKIPWYKKAWCSFKDILGII